MRSVRPIVVLVLGACACVFACQRGSDTTPPEPAAAAVGPAVGSATSADPLAEIDGRVETLLAAFAVPGLSVAIVKDGEVVHVRGYGVRERGRPERVDADTTFAIASNSKAFLATLVALQVHNKKLSWDDPVKELLTGFRMYDQHATDDIRLGNLLEHRSGLDTWAGDAAWIGSDIDTPTLLKRLRHVQPSSGLRERYGYTNLMFMVAGEVLRQLTGMGWEVLVRQQILDPLGMDRTTVSVAELLKQDNVATPHQGEGADELIVPYLAVDMVGAAAALNSSAADMARWLLLQTGEGEVGGKRILPAEVVADLQVARTVIPVAPNDILGSRHLQAYGRGWFLYDYAGHKVVTHGGGLPGMTSRTGFLPELDVGVVVLTNSESSAAFFVFQNIVDAYLGLPPRDYPAELEARKAAAMQELPAGDLAPSLAEAASLDLARYAGTYKQPLMGRAVVAHNNGSLSLALPDHGGLACSLAHVRADVFTCAWANPIFGTSPVAFEVAGGNAKSLRFKVRPEFIDPVEYRFAR